MKRPGDRYTERIVVRFTEWQLGQLSLYAYATGNTMAGAARFLVNEALVHWAAAHVSPPDTSYADEEQVP